MADDRLRDNVWVVAVAYLRPLSERKSADYRVLSAHAEPSEGRFWSSRAASMTPAGS